MSCSKQNRINRFLKYHIAIVIAVTCSIAFANDPNSPIEISTAAQMMSVTNDPNIWNSNFIVTDDIDMNYQNMKSIGSAKSPFNGSFNGQGHTISNILINSSDINCVGMFGYLGNNARVSNLLLEEANVTGANYTGALVGYSYLAEVANCKSSGNVQGSNCVGGLIGMNEGDVAGCYSEANVTANTGTAGGLIGNNFGISGIINGCYATGKVVGELYGGLAGENSGLTYCSFWNNSVVSRSAGGKGLSSSELKSSEIFKLAGWSAYQWTIIDGQDQPRLAIEDTEGTDIAPSPEIPLQGDGTEESPHLVSNAAELALLSRYSNILDKHIKLVQDIDMNGTEFTPIGTLGPFSGTFNGNGHIIRNLALATDSDLIGLFSVVYIGHIKNVGISNVKITGNSYIGGLAGLNIGGQINSCYVTGEINGLYHVGSIAGFNIKDTIDQ